MNICDGCGERYEGTEGYLVEVEYRGEVVSVCRDSQTCLAAAKAIMDASKPSGGLS